MTGPEKSETTAFDTALAYVTDGGPSQTGRHKEIKNIGTSKLFTTPMNYSSEMSSILAVSRFSYI